MATDVLGLAGADSRPYRVVLGGDSPVDAPEHLRRLMPEPGTLVMSGPAGVERVFDPADPVAVMVWLHGYTDVVNVSGRDPLAPLLRDSAAPEGAVN